MVTVLLVEDDQAIVRAVIRGLTDLGHEVVALGEGSSVVATVRSCRPDVLVLDLGLPDVDGATVLSVVRSLAPVPTVVITGRSSAQEQERILALGADACVVKPFRLQQLQERIAAVLDLTEVGPAPTDLSGVPQQRYGSRRPAAADRP